MRLRSFLVLSAVTIFAFSVVSATCAQAGTLKIGGLFAVTGRAAWLGGPEKRTAEMIVEEVNKAGGINGAMIELVVEDTEGKPAKTVTSAAKLIFTNNVLAVIGPSRSGCTMAIKDLCNVAQVPLISCAAAEVIINPLVPYVFKTPQVDSHVIIRIYEQMNKMGIKKVGLITGTTPFGKEGRKQAKKYAQKMGFEIVADETYGPKEVDMTEQLKMIKAAGAQAVINWSIVPAQCFVPKNMKALGMMAVLFQSHGFGNPKYIAGAGQAADGIMFPAGAILVADLLPDGHWQKTVVMAYKKAYEGKYSQPVSTFGGHAFDAMLILLNAMKAANITPDMDVKTARTAIRDAIEKTTGFVGVHGVFNMSANDHVGLDKDNSLMMLCVDKGKVVICDQ